MPVSQDPVTDGPSLATLHTAEVTNEAEVETKILLHLFRWLGFSDKDRADKPPVSMQFGRERKIKRPDFVLYDGGSRTITSALIAVEAKAPNESLNGAETQVISYAAWAGTPLYLACNGAELLISLLTPGQGASRVIACHLRDLPAKWAEIKAVVGRTEAILLKESLAFFATVYLPNIDQLAPDQFFREYIERLRTEIEASAGLQPLLVAPQRRQKLAGLSLPVTLDFHDAGRTIDDQGLAEMLNGTSARILVDGPPGAGKSTVAVRALGRLASVASASDGYLLPVFLPIAGGVPVSAEEAFLFACKRMGVRVFPEMLRRVVQRAQFSVILDGFDESSIPLVALSHIRRLSECLGNGSICVTTRPTAIDGAGDWPAGGFLRATVRPLGEVEIRELIRRGVDDVEMAERLILHASTHVELQSPLMVLLAIQVTKRFGSPERLGTYELFRNYVEIAHAFFSSEFVRGGAAASVSAESVLALVARCAAAMHRGRAPLSLSELRSQVVDSAAAAEFEAVMNTGILTSNNGAATFIHEGFEDFGLAHGLLGALRSVAPAAIGVVPVTPNSYQMVRVAVGPDELAIVRDLLSHSDKHVRKRAVGVATRGDFSMFAQIAAARLFVEPSPKVARRLLLALIAQDENATAEMLEGTLGSTDARRLASIIALGSPNERLDLWLVAATEQDLSLSRFLFRRIGETVVDPALVPRVATIYQRLTPEQRVVASLGLRKSKSHLARVLARNTISTETSPQAILSFLQILGPEWRMLEPADQLHIAGTIGPATVGSVARIDKLIRGMKVEGLRTDSEKAVVDALRALKSRNAARERTGELSP